MPSPPPSATGGSPAGNKLSLAQIQALQLQAFAQQQAAQAQAQANRAGFTAPLQPTVWTNAAPGAANTGAPANAGPTLQQAAQMKEQASAGGAQAAGAADGDDGEMMFWDYNA